MKTYTPRFFLLFVSIFLSYNNLTAQFNLQVGYGLGFVNLAETKHILEVYRLQNPWLTTDFKEIKYLNSLMIGLRQSWNGLSMGLAGKYRFNEIKGEGIEPLNNTVFNKELFFKLLSFSFSLESGSESFHVGTSLDYNILYIKERHTGSNDKFAISNENQWGSQFYVNINFPASSICQISLQPYYFMPWSDFSLVSLQNNLQIAPEPLARKESFRHFGISLILSNGPQKGN